MLVSPPTKSPEKKLRPSKKLLQGLAPLHPPSTHTYTCMCVGEGVGVHVCMHTLYMNAKPMLMLKQKGAGGAWGELAFFPPPQPEGSCSSRRFTPPRFAWLRQLPTEGRGGVFCLATHLFWSVTQWFYLDSGGAFFFKKKINQKKNQSNGLDWGSPKSREEKSYAPPESMEKVGRDANWSIYILPISGVTP